MSEERYDDLIAQQSKIPQTAQAPTADSQPNVTPQLSREDYAAKKKTERDNLSELAKQTEAAMVGDGGKFQQYLNTLSRFERYSPQNTLLIYAQRPGATRIGDYEHWKDAETPVNKGAAGIAIFEPGAEYTKEDGSVGVSMNIKHVFDVSQTAARNKTQPVPTRDIRDLLRALMSNPPVPIKLVDALTGKPGAGALYQPQQNVIEVTRGLNGDSLYRCLAQEIAYAEIDRSSVEVKEPGFTAYAASYTLCQKYGVDTKGYDFSSVPDSFNGLEGKDVRGEIRALRDTVNDIAGRMVKTLEQQKSAPAQEARA